MKFAYLQLLRFLLFFNQGFIFLKAQELCEGRTDLPRFYFYMAYMYVYVCICPEATSNKQ